MQKVDGSSHRILVAGGPGLHSIQEALANLLITTSTQMTDYLQKVTDRETSDKHHGSSTGHHGTTSGQHGTPAGQHGTSGSSASTAGVTR